MTDAPRSETPEAAPSPGLRGVGEALSRARAANGLSVDDVAQQLKFKPRQIEALEQERFTEFAGGVFVRGMVRSYARLVKLDGESLVARLGDAGPAVPAIDASVSFRRPVPFSDSARRARLGYGFALLVVLGVVAALLIDWPRDRFAGGELTFVQPARGPAIAPVPDAAADVSLPKPAQAVGVPLAAVAPQVMASATSSPAAEPAAAAPATPVSPSPGQRRLSLQFTQAAWVEVRDANEQTLVSSLQPGGTTRVVEGVAPFRLVIGNAQHVRLRDGERAIDLAPHTRLDVARFTLE